MLNYNANDPNTPIVISNLDTTPPNPCPSFSVQGRSENPQIPGQLQAEYVNAVITNAIKFIQPKTPWKLSNWARTRHLVCIPRAGKMFNAYYDGGSLRFFYENGRDGVIYTCDSSDIVSHELGHAVLDAWRPDLWNTNAIEVFAFHESFGDMMAILHTLSYNEVIDYIIQETGGNIRLDNAVTRLAEQMGLALTGRNYLRNAVNEFKYVDPTTLPRNSPPDQLAQECHNFSRVFTGAFWDMVCNQYEKNGANKEALIKSRDECASILFQAVHNAPNTGKFFDSVAREMLKVDSNLENKCKESIVKAFSGRNIFLSMDNLNLVVKMDNEKLHSFSYAKCSSVRVGGTKTVKLIDHLLIACNENPLYSVDVDIPCEHCLNYDHKGNLIDQRISSFKGALVDAKLCLDYIYHNDRLGDDKEFKISNNKLVRNYICSCH